MNAEALNSFFSYCNDISNTLYQSLFVCDNTKFISYRIVLYSHGIIPGLYQENDERLLELLSQPCGHEELIIKLLNTVVMQYENSEFTQRDKKNGIYVSSPLVKEPIFSWIADYNSELAFPMCKYKSDMLAVTDSELVLSYVYICLAYDYKKRMYVMNSKYKFNQPQTEALYNDIFDKSSEFKTWGLLPVDDIRRFFSADIPARLYDVSLNRTIWLDLPYSLAAVLGELCTNHCIVKLAIRSLEDNIYLGENHMSVLNEALERGRTFSWNINTLPSIARLYNGKAYDDCLWVIVEGNDITFEELCDDLHVDDNNVVTQMIHLQHSDTTITHLDHEYIFYDIDSYEARKLNPKVKGEARKRVKTFKIDNSAIPMDYKCTVLKDDEEITVPFIFFVLNSYFEHKDLLEEYFQKIM